MNRHINSTTLDRFVTAYINAALWSSTDEDGSPLDAQYSADDLAPETLEQMTDDCRGFLEANAIPEDLDGHFADAELAGQEYWLTRNGHGAGFWDRGLGAIGKVLTDAAHAFGSRDIYVADAGKIYVY